MRITHHETDSDKCPDRQLNHDQVQASRSISLENLLCSEPESPPRNNQQSSSSQYTTVEVEPDSNDGQETSITQNETSSTAHGISNSDQAAPDQEMVELGNSESQIESDFTSNPIVNYPTLPNNHGRHVKVEQKDGNTLIIKFRQEPQRSRMIGFAEKDRRPIDPPPVLELICVDKTGKTLDCSNFCHELVACASLFCKDAYFNRSQIRQIRLDADHLEDSRIFNSLEGETDANCQVIFDENGRKAFFFIFPQLSVRIRGEFRLKFVIVNPREAEKNINRHCPIIAEIFSEPFIVYSIKNFPGVKETTELSSLIRNQGIRFNSRRFGVSDERNSMHPN